VQEAGVDLVTVGVFAWAAANPTGRSADVVAGCVDGPLPGSPDGTRRSVGEDAVWYVATWLFVGAGVLATAA
jgi:hypothetical protein